MRYDEFSRPLPSCQEYLKRLGAHDGFIAQAPISATLDGAGAVSLDAPGRALLDALIFAHQTHIPFDAIDPHDFKKPANLDIEVLFDKIIRGQRGGFCFELGALFGTLLKELGFSTAPCIARNVRAQEDFPPIMHRAELVDIDGVRHYADVGYGGPMAACAIPLIDGAGVESCGQRFIMRKPAMPAILQPAAPAHAPSPLAHAASAAPVDPAPLAPAAAENPVAVVSVPAASSASTESAAPPAQVAAPAAPAPAPLAPVDPWWLIEYQTSSMPEPAPLMYFLDAAMKPQDFDPLAFYCSAHPSSVFVRERLVNLRTANGSKSIRNMVFTTVSPAGTEQRTLKSTEELRRILYEEFGISVPVTGRV